MEIFSKSVNGRGYNGSAERPKKWLLQVVAKSKLRTHAAKHIKATGII
jgi:hypothetical protein